MHDTSNSQNVQDFTAMMQKLILGMDCRDLFHTQICDAATVMKLDAWTDIEKFLKINNGLAEDSMKDLLSQ